MRIKLSLLKHLMALILGVTAFALPACAQYGGIPVGIPKFVFKDGQTHMAGKAFGVNWFKGRKLLIAPYHLLGPAGGFGHYVDPRNLPTEITAVNVMDLQRRQVVATAGHALTSWACPVERSNGDLGGDLMAFELPGRCNLPVLTIAPPLLPAKTKVWVLTKTNNSTGTTADRYAGEVTSCYRTAMVLKMDQVVDAAASSGSPVVNDKGQMVGMMVGTMDDARRNVACIPAQNIYERLLKEVGQ